MKTPTQCNLIYSCPKCALFLLSVLPVWLGCSSDSSPIPRNEAKAFAGYWYQGKAEITSYAIEQARYGATNDGHAIFVFVTEDFNKSKGVKIEHKTRRTADAIGVMKMSMIKQFTTGIYEYNMMSAVYTPLDYEEHPHSLKLTSGIQEWCGQTYFQASWKGHRYEVQRFSYFEAEGDSTFSLVNTWLEDEMWNKIRVAPNTLPLGKVKMVPAAFYFRLSHTPVKVYDAVATLQTTTGQYTYVLTYPGLKRTLEITFERNFPHQILQWKEEYGEKEITTGKLVKSIQTDYWNHNRPEDEVMRELLQLNAPPKAN